MERAKRERLQAKGWKIGTVSEFLEVTPEESTLIDIKLAQLETLSLGMNPKFISIIEQSRKSQKEEGRIFLEDI